MSNLRTMGDLRGFLAQAMQDVRDGSLDESKATHIAKLAAQINSSVHAEIAARVHLNMDKGAAFNQLAISGGINVRQIEHKSEKDEFIGKREKTEKAEWYPDDWGDICKMIKNGRSKKAIADDYGVTLEDLEAFIEENQPGES